MNLMCVLKEVCSERRLIEIRAQRKDPTFARSLKGKLKLPLKEGKKLEKDCQMRKLTLKAEIGNEEYPNSLCMRVNRHLNLKKGELLQASQWANQAQGERMNLCLELELRNRFHHENQVRTIQEIEELRRICNEEANQERRFQAAGRSLRQEKDLNTVSELLTQSRELEDQELTCRGERISRS